MGPLIAFRPCEFMDKLLCGQGQIRVQSISALPQSQHTSPAHSPQPTSWQQVSAWVCQDTGTHLLKVGFLATLTPVSPLTTRKMELEECKRHVVREHTRLIECDPIESLVEYPQHLSDNVFTLIWGEVFAPTSCCGHW